MAALVQRNQELVAELEATRDALRRTLAARSGDGAAQQAARAPSANPDSPVSPSSSGDAAADPG